MCVLIQLHVLYNYLYNIAPHAYENMPYAMQFIAAHDAAARNPENVKVMKTRNSRGDKSSFVSIVIIETAAATADLQAIGMALDSDGREGAADYLEQKQLDLGQTMAFYLESESRAAANTMTAA